MFGLYVCARVILGWRELTLMYDSREVWSRTPRGRSIVLQQQWRSSVCCGASSGCGDAAMNEAEVDSVIRRV